MNSDIETPVGRIVAGNPLETRQVIDDKTNQPKLQKDGITPRVETYFGLAIAKQGEAHWWDTPWGAQILAVGQRDWPNGEYQQPTFAWKIVDGDSQVPNKAGKRPCDQEGYAGHWILNCSTGVPVRCFRNGQFEAYQVLQPAAKEIKTGDYGRAILNVVGNGSAQSPGVYMNPQLFDLVQAGPVIITSSGPDPHTAFATAPTMPANALPDPAGTGAATPPAGAPGAATAPPATGPGMAPPPTAGAPAGAPGAATPPASMPAPQVQTPPAAAGLDPNQRRTDSAGNAFTVAQLRAAGWTEDQIAAAPVAQ